FVPAAGAWRWRGENNAVQAQELLPVRQALSWLLGLGFGRGCDAAALNALDTGMPAGQYWRVFFSRPLKEGDALVGEATVTPRHGEKTEQHWNVPFPGVDSAEGQQGDVVVRLRGAKIASSSCSGLVEAADAGASAQRGQSRYFRFTGQAGI